MSSILSKSISETFVNERRGLSIARLIHTARDERLTADERKPAVRDVRLPLSDLLYLTTKAADEDVRTTARKVVEERVVEGFSKEARAALTYLFENSTRLGMTVSASDVRMALDKAVERV
jgi:hypothetical protein